MRRRGFSLIEMMVVVVLLGIVAALTASVLLTLFRADRLWQDESAGGHALAQLEIQLRDDVHAAQKAEVDGKRLSLSLSSSERIVYTSLSHAVTRELLRVEQDEERIIAQDRLALPRGRELTWRTVEQDQRQWLFVEFQAPTTEPRSTARVQRDAHFEILVGRQRRSAEPTP